jgi:hypothetical protein
MKRSIRRWLLLGTTTLVVAASAGAVGVAWYLREHRDTYFTDADTIHRPIDAARPRDILWRPPVALPPIVNTPDGEYGPVMSPDGSTLYYVGGQAGRDTDIYFCVKTPTGWSRPRALGAINSEADELDPAPSPDGRALYFVSNRPGGRGNYDLWVAHRDGGTWSAPVNLGERVNTRYDETGPSPTPDGLLLYFASNRPGEGVGAGEKERQWGGAARDDPRAADFDLYTVGIDNPALTPTPVVTLNTPHDETACAVSPAGDFVYFSSDRPGGEGGFDLYRARRLEGAYTAPRNLGPPVNTPDNELDPAVSLGGFGLHYAGHAGDGAGYDVLYTTSREVFTRTDRYRASLDWAALWAMIWPYLLATLIAAAILLALIRALTRLQYRRLTLLAKCMLVSLLVHMLLMLSFAFWSVSTAMADRSQPGSGMRVVLTSPSIGAGLAAQIRGELTSVEVEAAVPEPAETRRQQDTLATLPPAAVPTPQTPPTEVAPSRVDTPDTPTVADASREAPAESQELPEPDLAAAAGLEESEPLTVELPAEAARSARPEAVMAVPVPAASPAEAHRTPAEALADAPAPSAAVTLALPSTDPLTHPGVSESLAETAPHQAAPQSMTPAVVEPGRAPSRSVALELPEMRSPPSPQQEAPLTEARLDMAGVGAAGGAVHPARAPDVALPVETAPGRAVPRAEVTPLAAAVDLASMSLAEMPGQDASSSEVTPPTATTSTRTHAGAVSFDLPVLEETTAVARAGPAGEADLADEIDVSTPASQRARWTFEPESAAAPAAVAVTDVPPTTRALDSSATPSAATLSEATAREAPSPSPAPVETAAAAAPASEPISLDLPWLEDAPAASEPEAMQRLALTTPQSSRSHSAPRLSEASPRAIVRPADVDLPPVEIRQPDPAVDLARPDVDTRRLDAADPELPVLASLDLDLALPTQTAPPPNPYAQRSPQQRQEILEEMGGSAETERAVAMALDWLARHQSRNGRWDGDRFDDRCGRCSGTQRVKCDIALTGLSLLCFTAADHTHVKDGPYRHVVDRAVTWLLDQQTPTGSLMVDESMYSHGIATIALAEAYGMTGDPRLEGPVKAAVDFIYRARNTSVGGWRYRPGQMGDTSVLGWQIMALTSAKRGRIDVPEESFSVARHWLDLVERSSRPGLYTYQPQRQVTPAMTAEGMFVRQLLGAERDDPRMRGSASYVLQHPPQWEPDANTYYWYYATLALFQHQGRPWQQWNEAVKNVLLGHQRVDGRAAGSWDPQGQWADVAGRVYQTAMATLTLEVYYRYLPSFVDTPTANGP